MAKKRTLYKIPTEAEISGAKAPKVEVADVPNLPVMEPEPVAVLDTAEDKARKSAALEIAKQRAAERLAENISLEEKRKSISVVGHYPGEPVDDFDSISVGDAKIKKSNEEARLKHDREQAAKNIEVVKESANPQEVYDHKTARLIFGSETDFTQMEGISVGGRNVVHTKNVKRVTRERRRENIEKRNSMKVMVAGEEQELSEASKYMLDMLIKNPNKE